MAHHYRYIAKHTGKTEDFTTDKPLEVGGPWNTASYAGRIGRATAEGFLTYADSRIICLDVPAAPVQPTTDHPDGNPKSAQGAKKHSLHLVPTAALIAESEAFADGVAKYGAANWRKTGVAASVYVAAAMRHIALWHDGGEDRASDSGAKHLGHARACLGIILDAEACGKLIDDRPEPMPNLEALLTR
jgi:hypothetical protein